MKELWWARPLPVFPFVLHVAEVLVQTGGKDGDMGSLYEAKLHVGT